MSRSEKMRSCGLCEVRFDVNLGKSDTMLQSYGLSMLDKRDLSVRYHSCPIAGEKGSGVAKSDCRLLMTCAVVSLGKLTPKQESSVEGRTLAGFVTLTLAKHHIILLRDIIAT